MREVRAVRNNPMNMLTSREQGELEFLEFLDGALSSFLVEVENGHAKKLAGDMAAKHHDRLAALRHKATVNETADLPLHGHAA
jgi:hypothetical protein